MPSSSPVACVEALEARQLLSASSVIDLMVLYTPQALAQAHGKMQLGNAIHRAVADTNFAFTNSQVHATLRLVYWGAVSYNDSGVLATDLMNLQDGSGALAGVGSLRERYGADLVSLWVGSGSGDEAGLALQPAGLPMAGPQMGFNVVEERYATDNFVFAHEIGHNLGAGHDRTDPTYRAIPYAYGKTFTLGHYTVGDIMSDVDRIPYFSNPAVSYEGIATGNPDDSAAPADNARVINDFAPVVARYEATGVPDTSGPQASIESVSLNLKQHLLTVKVQFIDDTAVAVSSLGTGAVVVVGPGGFRQSATFDGVDVSSDGSQRVAAYVVMVNSASASAASYQFLLAPRHVHDIFGNYNPGGSLGAPDSDFPDRAGPRLSTAMDLRDLDLSDWHLQNWVDPTNPSVFYRFSVTEPSQFTAVLSGVTKAVDELLVQDRNGNGSIDSSEILSYPHRTGTSPETISLPLSAGVYELWVAPPSFGTTTYYDLNLRLEPLQIRSRNKPAHHP